MKNASYLPVNPRYPQNPDSNVWTRSCWWRRKSSMTTPFNLEGCKNRWGIRPGSAYCGARPNPKLSRTSSGSTFRASSKESTPLEQWLPASSISALLKKFQLFEHIFTDKQTLWLPLHNFRGHHDLGTWSLIL